MKSELELRIQKMPQSTLLILKEVVAAELERRLPKLTFDEDFFAENVGKYDHSHYLLHSKVMFKSQGNFIKGRVCRRNKNGLSILVQEGYGVNLRPWKVHHSQLCVYKAKPGTTGRTQIEVPTEVIRETSINPREVQSLGQYVESW